VRVVAKGVAAAYTGGASTPFIESLEKEVGGPSPEATLGFAPMSRRAFVQDTALVPASSGYSWADVFGTATGVLQAYGGARRAISPIAMSVSPAEAGGGPRAIGGGVAGGSALMVRAILLRVRSRLGYGISVRGIVDLVRRFGPGVVLTFLGLGVEELMTLWFHHERRGHRRRARGISGRDITRAQRTIRRMSSFMCRVQEVCAAPGVARAFPRRRARARGCRGCGRRPCVC